MGGDSLRDEIIVAELMKETHSFLVNDPEFWSAAIRKAFELKMTEFEMLFVIYKACGMPIHQAYEYAATALGVDAFEGIDRNKQSLGYMQRYGKQIYNKPEVMTFFDWLSNKAEEYALNTGAFDWGFTSSSDEMRFLIDVAHEDINAADGHLTGVATQAILGAVRELNSLYKLTGPHAGVTTAKQVIFLGEGDIPD